MTFFKSLMLGTAIAMATTTMAQSQAQDRKIKEIDVVVQFSAVDANALQFYPNLETDLEQKLGEALAPMRADDGGRLMVFVTGVTVDGSAILTASGAFNGLDGGVQFYQAETGNTDKSSGKAPLTTDIRVVGVPQMPATIDPTAPAYLILPSDATVYEAMLDKFAEVVAERLPQMN